MSFNFNNKRNRDACSYYISIATSHTINTNMINEYCVMLLLFLVILLSHSLGQFCFGQKIYFLYLKFQMRLLSSNCPVSFTIFEHSIPTLSLLFFSTASSLNCFRNISQVGKSCLRSGLSKGSLLLQDRIREVGGIEDNHTNHWDFSDGGLEEVAVLFLSLIHI